jgi:N-6 DNA methylase
MQSCASSFDRSDSDSDNPALGEIRAETRFLAPFPCPACTHCRHPDNLSPDNRERRGAHAWGNSTTGARPPPDRGRDHQKELVKLIGGLAYRHSQWQVFSDFAEMAAISISNAVDIGPREKREGRYMEIVKRYQPDELQKFPQMFGELTLALEDEPSDVLGQTFHDLELHNKWAGQFFTPYVLCRMMAKMIIGNAAELEAKIADRGFVTAQEPAAGSGAMVIALAQEMRDAGVNYQRHLHVTAIDVDAKCVHMAYLQFSLLHIPAVIVHGNSLSLEEFGHWHTPAHIMDGWDWKLRLGSAAHELEAPPGETENGAAPERSTPSKPFRPTQLALF